MLCKICNNTGREAWEVHNLVYGVIPRFCECEHGGNARDAYFQEPEQVAKFSEYKKRKISLALQKSGVSDRFQDKRLSDIKDSPKLFEICSSYVNHWEEMKTNGFGLYLWGNVGTWKTHTASAIANELIEKHLVEVMFVSFSEVANRVRKSFDDSNSDKQLFDDMREVELLVIDDFGMEKPTDWLKEQIFLVINARYENRKPIIITSNQSVEDIGKFLMPQIASRLLEVSRTIKFTWEDRRIRKEQWWEKL